VLSTTEPGLDPFFDGLAVCELRLPHCEQCRRVLQPGVRRCHGCFGQTLEWRAASGRGTLHSYVVVWRPAHPSFDPPYAVCVVELEEGPRLVASITGVQDSELTVGMRLELSWDASAVAPPLRFRPNQS
jgi:uncharacterized OB-fold protein